MLVAAHTRNLDDVFSQDLPLLRQNADDVRGRAGPKRDEQQLDWRRGNRSFLVSVERYCVSGGSGAEKEIVGDETYGCFHADEDNTLAVHSSFSAPGSMRPVAAAAFAAEVS